MLTTTTTTSMAAAVQPRFFFLQLLPLTLFLVFLLQPFLLPPLHSNLGILCALFLIVAYSLIDKFYGLVVCLVFILLLQYPPSPPHLEEEVAKASTSDTTSTTYHNVPLITKDVITLIGIGAATATAAETTGGR